MSFSLKNKWARRALVASPFLLWGGYTAITSLNGSEQVTTTDVSYTEFLEAARNGEIEEIITDNATAEANISETETIRTAFPTGESIASRIIDENLPISVTEKEDNTASQIGLAVLPMLPMLLFMGLILRSPMMRQSLGLGGEKGYTKEKSKVRFSDVAGIDEAKADLEEIVDFLKNPKKYDKVGAQIPKGTLLVGPPGTGKTLLAKAVAGEAGVPFYAVSGSQFVEMFVGRGAARIRDLFKQAKKDDPCIIFIDEIDALAKSRALADTNSEKEQTLNEFLVQLDGFSSKEHGIIIIGATNRHKELDPAVTRPGRLGREVYVPVPDLDGRIKILDVHLKKIREVSTLDVETIARGTSGFSGADLANLVNEAALVAAKEERHEVTQQDFEIARDKVIMGAERKIKMSEEERKITAYHEAGHAIVGLYAEGNNPLHKVSIIPRGQALGVTVSIPEEDRYHILKSHLMGQMAMLYGGREAEKMILDGDFTGGASSDIERTTNMARKMVCEWGMSELGAIRMAEPANDNLQSGFKKSAAISEETSAKIDEQVQKMTKEAEEMATKILQEHKDKLITLAEALLENETLEAEEIYKLLGIEIPNLAPSAGMEKLDMAGVGGS